VAGVSHEYVNSNCVRTGETINMSGQSIVNLGSSQGPMDAVRKKYVNEKCFKRADRIGMNQKAIKNVFRPTEEGDAATKGDVDSKSVGKSDLNMNGNSIRHINPTPIHKDEVVPKQWIEENVLNCYSPASTVAIDLNLDGHHISYMRAPEQNHHTATKGYADTKLSLLGGDMQGRIGMAGNRISHLGEPEQSNVRLSSANEFYLKRDGTSLSSAKEFYLKRDGTSLSSANEFYLKRDGTSWMRGSLHAGGFQVIRVGDPREEQDVVNLRTLQASATSVLEQATAAADTTVGDAVANHANILNRDIRTKSLNLSPQGTATKNFSMGGHFYIVGLPDPKLEHEAVNLRKLNQNVLNEIGANNLLEAQKY